MKRTNQNVYTKNKKDSLTKATVFDISVEQQCGDATRYIGYVRVDGSIIKITGNTFRNFPVKAWKPCR